MRGAKLRQLREFIKDNDKANDFAGLERLRDDRGLALWTKLAEVEERDELLQKYSKTRNQ